MKSYKKKGRTWFVNKNRLGDSDRGFDIQFWQKQGVAAIFAAAWDLVLQYHIGIKGEDRDKLRLQRSVVRVRRGKG